MMNYEEILMMMVTEASVNIQVTPTFISIVGYNNSQTHVDMLTADIKKWADDCDIKIVVKRYSTSVDDTFYNDNNTTCDTIYLYNEDNIIKVRIELFYH